MQLVILRTARYDDEREEVDFGEISVFVAAGFVITVRQGVASELRGARARLEHRPELLESRQRVGAVGDPRPGGRRLRAGRRRAGTRHRTGRGDRVLRRRRARPSGSTSCAARSPTSTGRCTRCWPWSPPSNAARPEQLLPYLHDVHDNLALVNEEVAAQRDLLATVLEANIAVISVEQTKVSVLQNATIEQLTKLSTIFLPLTFVTGFFGQNFGWLVDHIGSLETFLVFGIGALVIPCALLLGWFRMTARRRAAVPERDRTRQRRGLIWVG